VRDAQFGSPGSGPVADPIRFAVVDRASLGEGAAERLLEYLDGALAHVENNTKHPAYEPAGD
jgi:hypothetical protein